MRDSGATAETVASLTEEILEARFDANPALAREAGLSAWDGRLPDRSATGVARRLEELDRFTERLDALDPDRLSDAERVDVRLLRHECAAERHKLRDRRLPQRDPISHLEELDLTGYLNRDYAPARDRAAAACLHLEGVPRLLDEARAQLEDPQDPTVLATAVRLFRSWADFVDGDFAEAVRAPCEEDDGLRLAMLPARREASRAAREFAEDLEERRRTARPGAFAIGPDLLGGLLRFEEGVDVPLSRLLELGREDLEANREKLREVAARIDPSADPADVMGRLKADHPRADEVLGVTRDLLSRLRAFLVEKDVVSIPSGEECLVRETPPYLSWAFAMMDGPPSLAEKGWPGIYYVTPPGADWDEQRAGEWLSEFHRAGLTNTSVHEAWPGHFLHALHIRRNPSRVVRTSHTYSSAEAWAHYAEQLMVELDFGGGDPAFELSQLADALVRNVRLVAAIGLHCGDLSLEEAEWMFRRDAHLLPEAARAEAERGTFDPGYLNYTLGKLMLRKLRDDVRDARGADFSLRSFHDDFLYWGMAPVPIVRGLLLGPDAGAAL
ncbi:DUF885 domain-containing protein [bacterium]|nr:DUF885 domain-containing protein [bacterium]